MAEAKDLDEKVNLGAKLARKFSNEALAVGLSAAALVLAAMGFAVAFMGLFFMLQASAKINQQDIHLEQLSDDVATYRFQQTMTHAEMKAHGFELTPLEDPENE